jgi:hypothetical protein
MSVQKYPKIETLFTRREDFGVDCTSFRLPEFTYVDGWLVTEKINGMNIRVSLEQEDGEWAVKFYGRGDNTQFPGTIIEILYDIFTLDKMLSVPLSRGDDIYPITLYGEGYGAGIQKGGNYRKNNDVSFRLFDVMVSDTTWLGWDDVLDVAERVGVATVPDFGELWTTQSIVDAVKGGQGSVTAALEGTADSPAEGVVVRTPIPLYTKHGQRLMWKLKTKDFKDAKP